MSTPAITSNPFIPVGPNSPWANVTTLESFWARTKEWATKFDSSPDGFKKMLAETGLSMEGLKQLEKQALQAIAARQSEVGTPLTPAERAFVDEQVTKFETGGAWYKNPKYLAGGAIVLIAVFLWWKHKQAQRPGY